MSSSPSLQSNHRRGLRLWTWNLLAPDYAAAQKYPHVPAQYLSWEYRREKIVDILMREQQCSDLICLQEVQWDRWDELWERFCSAVGGCNNDQSQELSASAVKVFRFDTFGSVQQATSGAHPVGCVVLYRKDRFKLVSTESRSRTLITVFRDMKHDVNLHLATVHLEAGHGEDETRWNQLRSMFKRLDRHVDDEEEHPCVVLAGDFNSWRSTDPVLSILDGSADSESVPSSWKGMTQMFSEELSPPWKKRLLPLEKVNYGVGRPTFAGGSVLDYVWVSPQSISVSKALYHDPKGASADDDECDNDLCPPLDWPSRDVPTDHVPIGAVISYRNVFDDK